jgi:hypothetical protein
MSAEQKRYKDLDKIDAFKLKFSKIWKDPIIKKYKILFEDIDEILDIIKDHRDLIIGSPMYSREFQDYINDFFNNLDTEYKKYAISYLQKKKLENIRIQYIKQQIEKDIADRAKYGRMQMREKNMEIINKRLDKIREKEIADSRFNAILEGKKDEARRKKELRLALLQEIRSRRTDSGKKRKSVKKIKKRKSVKRIKKRKSVRR